MRPKKKLLLYCADEGLASMTRFALETTGLFRVQVALTADHVVGAYNSHGAGFFDAMLVVPSTVPGDEAAHVYRVMYPLLPCLYWGRASVGIIEQNRLPSDAPFAEVRDRLRTMCERKRGPKPVVVVRETVTHA